MSDVCSILIADDDPGVCLTLSDVLELKGHDVAAANSGTETLAACEQQPFDILLLDIDLPDVSGLDLIARVEEILPKIDVLVITGHSTHDNAALAVRPSTVAYMIKPLDLDRLLSIIDQIARRKNLEMENARLQTVIEQGKKQWESTFDAISDPIAIVAASGSILRVNLAFCRRFNTTFPEIVGRKDGGLIFGLEEESDEAVGHALLSQGRFLEERDDLAIPGVFLLSCYTVRLESGSGVIYVLRDVTARKKTEEALWQRDKELAQAQKMDAVGRLAGGVAHDFNNLLTIILGNAEVLYDLMREDDPLRERIATISRVAERSSLLTRQLLAFSRTQVIQPKACDLNTMVSVSESMLRRLIRENIEFRTVIEPKLKRVFMDPVQLEQIILNLILNARDAMPGGGTLTIRTSHRDLDANLEETANPAEVWRRYVVLSVVDTGCGMSSEILDKIFEPFFTTKEKGHGLGLSTVYGIVEKGGGTVRVESEPGRGTAFHVFLPPADAAAPVVAESEAPEGAVFQRPATVLLVEDEEMIRELARAALARAGHTVLTARDGEEALAVASRHGAVIELLITDVVVPKLDGPQLAEKLSATFTDLRVLFISGYVDRELPAEVEYLEKPFTMQKMLTKVGEVLA